MYIHFVYVIIIYTWTSINTCLATNIPIRWRFATVGTIVIILCLACKSPIFWSDDMPLLVTSFLPRMMIKIKAQSRSHNFQDAMPHKMVDVIIINRHNICCKSHVAFELHNDIWPWVTLKSQIKVIELYLMDHTCLTWVYLSKKGCYLVFGFIPTWPNFTSSQLVINLNWCSSHDQICLLRRVAWKWNEMMVF